ncbi:MAG TPA: nucleotide pyrophosphatase/phosphodiesterase family protein [Polyangiaceae bacterium]|jgi:predicted AlkP superfamily pyrophosphatase or phosphodiesterase|nr:nucleotide pyrophosphatase/phosphodiesterase family protein [Polyangiaceae bacterium]
MHPTLVLNVVGLTQALLPHAPTLSKLAAKHGSSSIKALTPAVTCSMQSTFLTGRLPTEHGIVGNGWYFRELSQIWFWRQSNALVSGEMLWDTAKRRDPAFRVAQLFWWYNMYSSADWSITPRPMYTADGRKIPDVYTEPPELREQMNAELGGFPLFEFWGPRAGINSSDWIAKSALTMLDKHEPTLTLVYLPHLDYDLQRFGPNHPRIAQAAREIDALVAKLIERAEQLGQRWVVLSEYGITEVTDAVHINRVLREHGLLRVREELGREQLDAGASKAFAVADHQVAQIYVRDAADVNRVRKLLAATPGIEQVLDEAGKKAHGLAHPRSGELVAISAPDRWFSYYFWLDDARAPDYARTVDIHTKPGYDPVELFLDPKLSFPMLSVGRRLLSRKLGFRTLLDVIPLDTTLVKGSHGRITDRLADGPMLISSAPQLVRTDELQATQIKDLLLAHVFD